MENEKNLNSKKQSKKLTADEKIKMMLDGKVVNEEVEQKPEENANETVSENTTAVNVESEQKLAEGENPATVEERCYSPYMLKRLKKLREKGRLQGKKIPYLKYELTKPEKPRVFFIILSIFAFLLLAGVAVVCGYLFYTMVLPMLISTFDLSINFEVDPNIDVFGFGGFLGGASLAVMWLFVIAFTAVLVAIIWMLASFARKMFVLTKASVQEVAVGYLVKNAIWNSILLIIGLIGGYIFVMVKHTDANSALRTFITIAVFSFVLLAGLYLTFVLLERKKAKKEFDKLSEEAKQDYLEHAEQMYKINLRKARSKSLLGNDVDF